MFFSLKKFNLLTFSDFERKTSGNCQSKFSGIVKTAFCLWTFSGKWTFCEKCTLSFHHLFSDTAWKNSGLSICPLENFEEKLWFFWKKYRFFLLPGLFRYKAKIFSSSLSNVPCTCKWEPPERKLSFFRKQTSSFITFRHCAKNLRCCLWIFFGRVAEAASYVSMKTIWGKTAFKGEVILLFHFCASSKVFCAWWQKFSGSDVKKAFYVSM